jgi:aldose 1-epimerase
LESRASSIKDHKLTIKSSKTLERNPDGLATGSLTSHDEKSPFNFNSHTIIGSIYPEGGYDDFYVFDRTEESVSHDGLAIAQGPVLISVIQIPKVFKEDDLTGVDYIRGIIDDDQANEAKVVLEGGESGIKLTFFSNRELVPSCERLIRDYNPPFLPML